MKEAEIVGRLQTLVEKENLDAEEAALALIASRADGSLRDAETILDQLSLLDRVITLSMVQELVRFQLHLTSLLLCLALLMETKQYFCFALMEVFFSSLFINVKRD